MRSDFAVTSYRRLAMQMLIALFGTVLTISSTWAVFVRPDGNTFKLQSEGYKAMGNAQLTITLGNETRDVTTDDKGNFCIKSEKNATEEDRRGNCAIFTGSGDGRITAKDGSFDMGFTLKPDGSVSVSPSQMFSNVELIGMGLAAGGLIYVATDDSDNSGTSNGGGSSGGGNTGGGSTGGGSTGGGSSSGTLNDCINKQYPSTVSTTGGNAGSTPPGSTSCNIALLSNNMKRLACSGYPSFVFAFDSSGHFSSTATGQFGPVPQANWRADGNATPLGNGGCGLTVNLQAGPPLFFSDEFWQGQLRGTAVSGP